MREVARLLAAEGSPFFLNVYPFFAYRDVRAGARLDPISARADERAPGRARSPAGAPFGRRR